MIKTIPTNQNGLVKVSSIDCFQIRSVSVERLITRIGSVEPEIISLVQEAVIKVVGAL